MCAAFDSQVLLPTLIDQLASADPDRLYCAFLETPDSDLTQVTYKQFANAVNKAAWWLKEHAGEGDGETFNTIAYYGPADIRPAIFTLAAAKTQHKAFLASPRNSIPGHVSLLTETKCNTLLVAADFPPFKPAAEALAKFRPGTKVLEFPPLKYWLEGDEAPLYSFTAKLANNPYRPYVVLHTSGSTGLPKPIVYTFNGLVSYITQVNAKAHVADCPPLLADVLKGNPHYVPLPSFHMVGLICLTAVAVYWNMPPLLGPATVFPNSTIATKIHSSPICKGSTVPPSILEDIASSPEGLDTLSSLNFVNWIGGPLASAEVADKLRARVPIYCAFGATEFGNIPLTIESQDDYVYLGFSPLVGTEFRPYHGDTANLTTGTSDLTEPTHKGGHADDLYELVFVRDKGVVEAQLLFLNNPTITHYATKDLFSPHPDAATDPSKAHMWRYRSRADDILNNAKGELINPIIMEATLTSDPRVTGALLIGTGRRITAWLVELKEPPATEQEVAKAREELWEVVQRANETAGPSAHVTSKEAVLFTVKEKPMARAGKGTVQRGATLELYKAEIDAMYEKL